MSQAVSAYKYIQKIFSIKTKQAKIRFNYTSAHQYPLGQMVGSDTPPLEASQNFPAGQVIHVPWPTLG